MNTEIVDTNNSLDVIFPEARTVTIARPGATTPETIEIYPLPVQKWKQGFKYIAQIAPMLGFDLFAGTMSQDDVAAASGADLMDKAEQMVKGDGTGASLADSPINTEKIYEALMGDGADTIIEFLAFATNKEVGFFDDMYDEVIDIMVAVIELNLNFFVQKLLPKILIGTRSVVATAQTIRKPGK